MDTNLSTVAASDSAVTRALRRVAHRITPKGQPASGSRVRTRDLSRVLLIEPRSGPGTVTSASVVAPTRLVAAAGALRAAGFRAEIYDAASAEFGADSIRLHIEHSFPQVVVAAAYLATSEAARDVLRAAKDVVPGVFTVLLGEQPMPLGGKTAKDTAVDCVVSGDGAEILPGLLARLRAAGQPGQVGQPRAA